MNIGCLIKHLRKKQSITQIELSNMIDIDQSYLSQLENSKKDPSISLLRRIADVTNTPLQLLILSSLTKEDVPSHKKDLYDLMYPKINEMLFLLFEK